MLGTIALISSISEVTMSNLGVVRIGEASEGFSNLQSLAVDLAQLSAEQLIALERYMRRLQLSKEPARLSAWQERAAKKVMMENLGCSIQISAVAKECSLSRSHFSRAFKNTTGLAPRDWLQLARLSQAKDLLEHTDFPISQIGLECGFSDQPHFTRTFSRKFGITPGQLRAKNSSHLAS